MNFNNTSMFLWGPNPTTICEILEGDVSNRCCTNLQKCNSNPSHLSLHFKQAAPAPNSWQRVIWKQREVKSVFTILFVSKNSKLPQGGACHSWRDCYLVNSLHFWVAITVLFCWEWRHHQSFVFQFRVSVPLSSHNCIQYFFSKFSDCHAVVTLHIYI